MPDYNFSGLSARSFERLIQAIAGSVIGPGTITFGDGPDGGREATFDGKMDYPSMSDPWDGYCVIQAKFLQRPRSSEFDGAWALNELEKELKAFADPGKSRRLPEYYVFATNVVLTPVQRMGGKDKAASLFRKYGRKVPLKGWAMWDFDELGKFLDTLEGVRKAYAAWITPGDVLAELLYDSPSSKQHDFLNVVTNFLAKEMRGDQFANLEQAGHTAEERIPLAHVFVDLSVAPRRHAEPPLEEEGTSEISELVAKLIERSKDSLDPASQTRSQNLIVEARDVEGPRLGRYVLVGGPGQGKTTVGQFACQLFRAVLLRDRPSHLLAPEVRDTLNSLLEHCNLSGVQLPTARRFPMRIVLSDYAAALNELPTLSVLAYAAQQVSRKTGREVGVEHLHRWLARTPWFLVLDGLDEVPPSTNREELLRKIEEFWIDASLVNADILVLATTRPQGYSEDFSPKFYHHLWLVPLSIKRAIHYAARFVDVRYGGEQERQYKILERLRNASKQDATARLMRSPLQVTILATLVDQIGNPPQDRWRLFHDYYEVIYNRERERPIKAAELLRDHKQNIDAIHNQVGLMLQVESERAGGTEAKMSTERFAKLVTARLQEEEYAGRDLESLRDRIIDAAANRLVFLVGLETGQVGFEIRSLQEYMAAEALMTGSQDKVQERLRLFAPIASWRNVFLFAAGRCFVRDQHLRDTIHTICIELNDTLAGSAGAITLSGSLLALELLEDGVSRHQPKYTRLLARCGARILELPPSDTHLRLADLNDGAVAVILHEEIAKALSVDEPVNPGAWATLLGLVARGSREAVRLAEEFWPSRPHAQLEVLNLPSSWRAFEWLGDRVERVLRSNPPVATNPWSSHLGGIFQLLAWDWFYENLDIKVVLPGSTSGFKLVSLAKAQARALEIKLPRGALDPGWSPLMECVRFSRNPSAKALTGALERLQRSREMPKWRGMSWVLYSCLIAARNPDDFKVLANKSASGELGDLQDWVAAENRWSTKGLQIEDLLCMEDAHLPFTHDIARRGFPVFAGSHFYGTYEPAKILGILLQLTGLPNVQDVVASFLFVSLGLQSINRESIPSAVSPEQLLSLIHAYQHKYVSITVVESIGNLAEVDSRWLDVLEELGKWKGLFDPSGGAHVESAVLGSLCLSNLDRIGLLPLAIASGKIAACDLPNVRVEEVREPMVRAAAIALELGRGKIDSERARELASYTASFDLFHDVVNILRRQEWLVEENVHFFLELLPLPAFTNRREEVINELANYLGKRSSGVAAREAWLYLGLPPELVNLL